MRRHPILAGFGVLAGLSLFAAYFPVSAIVTGVVVGAHATGIDRLAARTGRRLVGALLTRVHQGGRRAAGATPAGPEPASPTPAPTPPVPEPRGPEMRARTRGRALPAAGTMRLADRSRGSPRGLHPRPASRRPRHPAGAGVDDRQIGAGM